MYVSIWFGECVLVDGWIVLGCLYIDELLIIGESLFVLKDDGDVVMVGLINGEGVFVVVIIVIGVEMMFVCIICFVEFV